MYTIGDQVNVRPDPVRWPTYPDGFVGQILTVEDMPAFPGEVWAMVAVVVDGEPREARLVPLPLDLPVRTRQPREVRPDDVVHGPPRGFRRFDPQRSVRP